MEITLLYTRINIPSLNNNKQGGDKTSEYRKHKEGSPASYHQEDNANGLGKSRYRQVRGDI